MRPTSYAYFLLLNIFSDNEYMEKKHVEEPLFKYYLGKGKDLPIVFYNEDQEKIRSNVYMLALLQQMGLHLEEETGLLYPRIPSNMTVQELVELAKMLGKIDEGEGFIEFGRFFFILITDLATHEFKC
jgi:hypothetical protein